MVDVPLELLAPLKGSVLVRVHVTLRWVSTSDGASGQDDDTASVASGSTASLASSAPSAMSQSLISRVEALEQDLTGFAVSASVPDSPSAASPGPTTPDIGASYQQQRMAFGSGGSPHGSEQCSIPEEEAAQPFGEATEEEGGPQALPLSPVGGDEPAGAAAEPTPLPPWSPPPTVPRALRTRTSASYEDSGAATSRVSATSAVGDDELSNSSLIVQVAALQLSTAILRTQARTSTTTTSDAAVEADTVEAVRLAIQVKEAAGAEAATQVALHAEAEQLRGALGVETAAREKVTAQLAAAEAKHSADLAAAQEKHCAELAAAEEKHSAEVAAMQVKHAAELGAKDARIASLELMSSDAAGLARTASTTAAASAAHAETLQRSLDAEVHRREAAEARADSAWKRVISHTGSDDRMRAELTTLRADLAAARADLAAARAGAQHAHDTLAAMEAASAVAAEAAAAAVQEAAPVAVEVPVLDAAPAAPAQAEEPKQDNNPWGAAWGAIVHHTMTIIPKF